MLSVSTLNFFSRILSRSLSGVICLVVELRKTSVQVGSTGGIGNETTNNMMQKFWDSAMAFGPVDDDDDTMRFCLC